MRNHLRDPASADERGYRLPGLGHFLDALAGDEAFTDELLRKVLTARARTGQETGTRLRVTPLPASACPVRRSASRDDRL